MVTYLTRGYGVGGGGGGGEEDVKDGEEGSKGCFVCTSWLVGAFDYLSGHISLPCRSKLFGAFVSSVVGSSKHSRKPNEQVYCVRFCG